MEASGGKGGARASLVPVCAIDSCVSMEGVVMRLALVTVVVFLLAGYCAGVGVVAWLQGLLSATPIGG